MAADRGAFICQSQSMKLFVENPNMAKLSSMHFYAWEKGFKTGMYYLRSKAGLEAIKFTVPTQAEQQVKAVISNEDAQAAITCSIENRDDCESCSG